MSYKKILVPLDGSELAEKALPYARSIAKLKKSQIILFAVSLTIFVDRRDRLFSSYLDVNAKELNAEGLKTTTATGYGDVAEEIIKYANNNQIDLIIMATHGYSRARRLMFGSVTQKVLYGTRIPVLLIKSKSPEVSVEFNRILVPVDGSPFSESTLPYVEDLARRTNKEILLLHICEPPVSEMEHLAANYLSEKVAALKKKRIKAKFKVVRAQTGEVVKTIMKAAKEESADLVAIATQGRAGISRWVYGSVANRVVEELSYPILLIRPETSIPSSTSQNLLDDIWHSYLGGKV
jgi:nucleotide-binding universal stress UspA family protein